MAHWGGGLFAFSFFVAAVHLASGAPVAEEQLSLAGIAVIAWSEPLAPAPPKAPRPILIFSHGYHGCSTQSRFLMEAFAQDGYLVFAPNHRDAACGEERGADPTASPIREPEKWTEDSFRARAEDIKTLIAALKADPGWRDRIDWSRLGLVGHSLGGYTMLELAGAWPNWKLEGVRAVLGLSPYNAPFVLRHTMGGIAAPVMFQGGVEDIGITPTVSKPGGAYDMAPSPKYFVDFAATGHMGWTDVGLARREPIVDYSLAFLDRYVRQTAALPILTHKSENVAELRFDSELGKSEAEAAP